QRSGVSGVFPWNGRAIPLIDLEAVLHPEKPVTHPTTSDFRQKRILVIEAEEDVVGLSVDEVREIVRLQSDAFRAVHASDGQFTRAEVEWSDGVARLLDVES